MLRCVNNSLFQGKFGGRVRFLSNYVNDHVRDEIPPELEKLRQADMPKEMENPFEIPKPMCVLCKYNVKLDYKNVRLLSQFVSRFSGKVYGRHISGLCERQQSIVEKNVSMARACGLMPYYLKDPAYVNDPPLFDPDNPFRPHKY